MKLAELENSRSGIENERRELQQQRSELAEKQARLEENAAADLADVKLADLEKHAAKAGAARAAAAGLVTAIEEIDRRLAGADARLENINKGIQRIGFQEAQQAIDEEAKRLLPVVGELIGQLRALEEMRLAAYDRYNLTADAHWYGMNFINTLEHRYEWVQNELNIT